MEDYEKNAMKRYHEDIQRTASMIKSGMKIGADNLELLLECNDADRLGPTLDILNSAEVLYKQGDERRLNALKYMSEDPKLYHLNEELEDYQRAYSDAVHWLGILNKDKGYMGFTQEELDNERAEDFDDTGFPIKRQTYVSDVYGGPGDGIWQPLKPAKPINGKNLMSRLDIKQLVERLGENIIGKPVYSETVEQLCERLRKGIPTKPEPVREYIVDEKYRNDLLRLEQSATDGYAHTRQKFIDLLENCEAYSW